MWNLDAARVMHRHGEDWEEMRVVGDASPDSYDIERRILRGDRIYRCASCSEEIRVTGPDSAG